MTNTHQFLTTEDHSRDSAGLKYVYPVISRRAGALSIGINLNPNNACNWRCIYCQVPNLIRGDAPEIDLKQLESELRGFLQDLIHGDFMKQHIPPEVQRINDIALSGNGEPTSSKQFGQVIKIISAVLMDFQLLNKIKLVLITNGSFIYKDYIQLGLKHMAELNGEIWFKIDSATPEGTAVINQVKRSMDQVKKNLGLAALLCPTWIQTCLFALDGKHLSDSERKAYLAFLEDIKKSQIPVKGVLLYGLARASHQPEASRLSKVSESWLKNLAADVQKIGLPTKLAA